jgi:hypothetical protein
MVKNHLPKKNLKKPLGLDIVKYMYNIQHVIMRAISQGKLSAMSHQAPEPGV